MVLILKHLRGKGQCLKSHQTECEKPGIKPSTPSLHDIGLSPTPRRLLITLFQFVSIWSTKGNNCFITSLFHFASSLTTQNETKNQNENKYHIVRGLRLHLLENYEIESWNFTCGLTMLMKWPFFLFRCNLSCRVTSLIKIFVLIFPL